MYILNEDALDACVPPIDFAAGLFSGELRPTGIFVGMALLCWLIAWLDGRPGCCWERSLPIASGQPMS